MATDLIRGETEICWNSYSLFSPIFRYFQKLLVCLDGQDILFEDRVRCLNWEVGRYPHHERHRMFLDVLIVGHIPKGLKNFHCLIFFKCPVWKTVFGFFLDEELATCDDSAYLTENTHRGVSQIFNRCMALSHVSYYYFYRETNLFSDRKTSLYVGSKERKCGI